MCREREHSEDTVSVERERGREYLPFVKSPGVVNRNVHLVRLLKGVPESLNSSLKERSIGDIEFITGGSN